MPRSRLTATLYLILVFASGILVGIVAWRLYSTNTAIASTSTRSTEFRKRYLAGMREKVGVNETQIVEITKILNDTKAKLDALDAQEKPLHDKIQQEHVDAIKALLNDQQKLAYDKWREERERAKQLARQRQ